LDTSTGSIALALFQAVASIGLWVQGLVLKVLALTRAATRTGQDLDDWMADFDFFRLPAVAAAGQVTFVRATPTLQSVVLIGTQVQTTDGTQTFTVALDTTQPSYSPDLGGYVLAPGVASVTVPVQNASIGAAGNVLAGTISIILQPISGVDSVTNAQPMAGGQDAEKDPAFLVRFALYIAALSKATKTAVASAIADVQDGLVYSLTENQDYNGTLDYGYFYVVVDDGTGTPSGTLLASIYNAIDAIRGLSIRFGVFAPVVVTATPTMTITAAPGFVHSAVAPAVSAALIAAIDALPLGTALPYTRLSAIAYGVAGVGNVTAILLNGGTADLSATTQQVIKCGTPVVN
jgi:uncharacterized phage protein gp47/JayE